MTTRYYLLAALLAAVLLVVEHRLARHRGKPVYRLRETVSSLLGFAGELVLTAALTLNIFVGYELLMSHLALVSLPPGHPATWLFALLAVDFAYYWGHRACHRVGALWALHTVHHQSGAFNFAVGLRGPWLSALQIAPFMVPLTLLGIPTEVMFPVYAVHTVWKLLTHTQLIGKLGVLDSFLVTPSVHRVHHGRNAHYADKNFGGMFTIWDRVFGTFQKEDVSPDYGPELADPNPLRNNLEPWRELRERARAGGRLGWLRAIFLPPTSHPAVVPMTSPTAPTRSATSSWLVALALAVVGVGTIVLLAGADALTLPSKLLAGGILIGVMAWIGDAIREDGAKRVRALPERCQAR